MSPRRLVPSIRLRLTAWYALVLGLMLVVYATATFMAVRHEFHEQLDAELAAPEPPMAVAPADAALRSALLEARVDQQLWEIGVVLVLGLPLVVLLAAGGGYVLARRALAPIDRLASNTRRITAARLHERLSVPNPDDEIGRLAAAINETLARLEGSFTQLRRFTADASHELRTPLAVIRGIGEVGLGAPRTSEEYQEVVGSMLEEVDRLASLVDTLLRLSHADTGSLALVPAAVDLHEVAREMVASLGILADDRHQRIAVVGTAPVMATVDRVVLREALINVLDNAIKYGPPRSSIEVRIAAVDGRAIMTIRDEGPGIPPEHRERIFDRFFRVDDARSRAAGGSGLGLAIAKWAVEVNGGYIRVDDTVGLGTTIRIDLPA
jgi:heavy metal sensor kinase